MSFVPAFQSPQWGDNSKDGGLRWHIEGKEFQSPQWGDNSKGYFSTLINSKNSVSVPAMGR